MGMFFAGLFVAVAIAVFTLGHVLLLQAIFVGPAQEIDEPRNETQVPATSGPMIA